jgi:hypothetical protein
VGAFVDLCGYTPITHSEKEQLMIRRLFACTLLVCGVTPALHADDATIVRITFTDVFGPTGFTPGSGFEITPWRAHYFRSDGASWQSGSGSSDISAFGLASAVLDGSQLRYTFDTGSANWLISYTSFDSGNYSSTGTIKPYGPMTAVATLGSNVAILSGEALVAASGTGYDPPRGALYIAPVGSVVPITVSYALTSGSWALDTFSHTFSCTTTGSIEFSQFRLVPEPTSFSLLLAGLALSARARRRSQYRIH